MQSDHMGSSSHIVLMMGFIYYHFSGEGRTIYVLKGKAS